MVSPFDYGNYKFTLTDEASGILIWSQGYSTLFSEWQTTAEAKNLTKAFPENAVFPFPKKPAIATFYNRNKQEQWEKKYSFRIDPSSYFIRKERRLEYPYETIHKAGDPATSLDIVFVPEGYTSEELPKFKADCERLTGYLFKNQPYDKYADRINIFAVMAPSQESGTDVPG
jgi:hypothetical protein